MINLDKEVSQVVKKKPFTVKTADLPLTPRELIKLTDVAVMTAYKALDPKKAQGLDYESCLLIYQGLKQAGFKLYGRPIELTDIVELNDI